MMVSFDKWIRYHQDWRRSWINPESKTQIGESGLWSTKGGYCHRRGDREIMSVEQCVSEGLSSLLKNRSKIVPARLNRTLNALVPASLGQKLEADLLGKGLASKSASPGPSSSLARSTGS
jgi:hypothetical protein